MSLHFTKMHGLGNDFIIIDATKQKPGLDLDLDLIKKIADRRTGVGFDQLLLLEPPVTKEYDFTYRIFNADGQEVEQCGNGARCVAHYIFSEGLSTKNSITLATFGGRKLELKKELDGQITVNMGSPNFIPEKIPFITQQQAPLYNLVLGGNSVAFGAVSLGNPHAVLQVKDVAQAPVQQIGQLFQQHPSFPKQVNVGFMEIVTEGYIRLRVYERGVGETRACGSGACAAVAVGRLNHLLGPKVIVELPGGCLSICWQSQLSDISITGPAEKVFKGEFLL